MWHDTCRDHGIFLKNTDILPVPEIDDDVCDVDLHPRPAPARTIVERLCMVLTDDLARIIPA